MRTVNEVSKLTGVSIRTLQYYDSIGLLKPTEYTEAGYRLYDDEALERLQQILLFRELEFSLKEIKDIIYNPGFNKKRVLEQQIELLLLKKAHIENLIDFAQRINSIGVNTMDFKVFDKKKIEEHSKHAKEKWGQTAAYQEFEEKKKEMSDTQQKDVINSFVLIFAEFGKIKELDASCDAVQSQVKKLQDFITENYYNCTKEILSGLGKMYASGGEFTENIDSYGGEGTALFTAKAIEIFCK